MRKNTFKPNPAEPAKDETIELKKMLEERTNDLQRQRADFENYRKQVEKQRAASRETAEMATVLKLLPLLDDLNRAFLTYQELAPLEKTFQKTLAELKLVPIDTAPGTEFNPDLHDAVMVEGDGESEVIAETLRPGYCYNGKILRPAMVKVARS